jgi:segregation and condensation protein B
MNADQLRDAVHAVLFVAVKPLSVDEISGYLDQPAERIETAITRLVDQLSVQGPIRVVRLAGGYQLATDASYAGWVARVVAPERRRLSRSLMEVLSIVAYRQPITAAEVDALRGTQSDYSLRALAERRLITEVGRKAAPGRPILYGTTGQFLHQFRMDSLEDLPPLPSPGTIETT